MKRGAPRRRAFATLTAVTLVALAGVAVASMATVFTADFRRTRNGLADAQLRQLLTAGEAVAAARLRESSDVAEGAVPLPAELAAAGATLEIRSASPPTADERKVVAEASLGRRRAMQTMTYRKAEGRWKLYSAVLSE